MKNDALENKNSDAAYPLYDLAEAVKVAESIRDLGGDRTPVSKSLLAQHLKYAETGPSFFQRVSATKSFGLISGRGEYELTEKAKRYFFPTTETEKATAAVEILSSPSAFKVLVQRFDGGKLPANNMLGNILQKDAKVSVSKKDTVASCFVRSAQFLGVIDAGGFLRCRASVAAGNSEIKRDVQQQLPSAEQPAPIKRVAGNASASTKVWNFTDGEEVLLVETPKVLTVKQWEILNQYVQWIKPEGKSE
ncbi:MAG TPA: hypothetical protein VK810_04500 [Dongiaceae bacterium]|jgi:hypothetical protein|nr:hypothetical protein [Dongiaceae bacterium]